MELYCLEVRSFASKGIIVKLKWKIVLGLLAVVLAAGGFAAYRGYQEKGVTTVQTTKVSRGDLTSIVSASGEIKPKTYTNIGSYYVARLTNIFVKEGDRVRKGQVVATLENVQAVADLDAQRAAVSTSIADATAQESGLKAQDDAIANAQATVQRAKADLERTKIDYERTKELFDNKLIAKSDYDLKQQTYLAQKAALTEAETRVAQARAQKAQSQAQLNSLQKRVTQSQAALRRVQDVLDKYSAVAPFDGLVTNLPVRVGENVVPGIQNQLGSTIMTIADMSVITAEIKVDETDIVNVHVGQEAEIAIDAMPNRTFIGHVTEIGGTAILRSTGVAASQSANSTQEAKDFKVVVAMDNPPEDIRPGLSCRARVKTASRPNVVSVPIQALTTRTKADLARNPDDKNSVPGTVSSADKKLREEVAGVFTVDKGIAVFVPTTTGITGTTDIEVTSGLKEGDEIITGPYKVIKTIANKAKVKVDNKPPAEQKP